MIAADPRHLAAVTGGDATEQRWWDSVIRKGNEVGTALSGPGAIYGGFAGAYAAKVGRATFPVAPLATAGGAMVGAELGYGLGFVGGAGLEAYRTWNK